MEMVMGLKISVLTNDGSPLGVTETSIQGDSFRVGVGGSELAMLTMCRLWHEAGHTVTLYNNPWTPNGSVFEQKPISAFDPNGNRDFLIIFRSPNPRAIPAKGKKIWWSCDQYTVGDFQHFSEFVDKIVCISPFHADYFERTYGIKNTVVIDLPVRMWEMDQHKQERIANHLVFTSVPDRGLQNLWRIYPKIKQYVPDLTLTITSDYRLWGASELNQQHRGRWIVHEGVNFCGALPRKQYLEELSKADMLLFPCNYDELFCLSVAEAQVAGVVCISSTKGALSTTNMGHLFYVNADDPRNDRAFIDRAVEVLHNRVALEQSREIIQSVAKERFSPEKVLSCWDKLVFEGNEK
jgi:glycosyltransferase involved in cell wall biosynthesis